MPKLTHKDRSQFLSVLRKYIETFGIDENSAVLVVGGTEEDVDVLQSCGFHDITVSNIDGVTSEEGLPVIAIDAENTQLSDDSFDIVFVHEVIHHCRCPQRAFCEMLRIARLCVIMMEPNDSAFMRLLCWARFSFPYEIAAVVDNDYVRGGVRNSQIPNFIYRWSAREAHKATASYLAEYTFSVCAYPYWDFNVNEKDLAYRAQTRIGKITRVIGAGNFITLLRAAQAVLNRIPLLRRQGNKFFCAIQKSSQLQPWLVRCKDSIAFDRRFQQQLS